RDCKSLIPGSIPGAPSNRLKGYPSREGFFFYFFGEGKIPAKFWVKKGRPWCILFSEGKNGKPVAGTNGEILSYAEMKRSPAREGKPCVSSDWVGIKSASTSRWTTWWNAESKRRTCGGTFPRCTSFSTI